MAAENMARVQTFSSISAIPKDAWNGLVGSTAHPVMRWEWLNAMEHSQSASPERGWQAHHYTLWEGERLIGAAPAYLKFHSMGEYVYDFGWANSAASAGIAYYPKLLVSPPLSPITAPRFHAREKAALNGVRETLVAAMVEDAGRHGWSSIHVIFEEQGGVEALSALGFETRLSMQYHWSNPGYATYEDYLLRFDSKRRNQLRREKKAAAVQGVQVRTLRGNALTDAHAKLAFSFYQATVQKNGFGPLQLNEGFFTQLFHDLPEHVELVVAERENRVIAGAFNLVANERLYGRYWGCFEDVPFLHFNVCLYHSIEESIVRKLRAFEPGAGGEHKIPRGFVPTRTYSAHRMMNPAFHAAVSRFCRREAAEIEDITARGEEIAGMRPSDLEDRSPDLP